MLDVYGVLSKSFKHGFNLGVALYLWSLWETLSCNHFEIQAQSGSAFFEDSRHIAFALILKKNGYAFFQRTRYCVRRQA
jgi:hypothetical protein